MTPDVTILHGDCLERMRELPGKSVDLVITSPPYNLGGAPWPHLGHWKAGDVGTGGNAKWKAGGGASKGFDYGSHADNMPHDEYVRWQQSVLLECWRLLKDDGAIFYNHKPRVIGPRVWIPTELNPGLPLRQIVIWARDGGVNCNAVSYMPTHEWIMVIAKESFRLRDRAASGVGDVWRITQDRGNPHPAPFPLEIPRRILATTKGDIILDPFAGSGTTGVACMKAGRKAILIELNADYIPVIERRVKAAETPLFSGLDAS